MYLLTEVLLDLSKDPFARSICEKDQISDVLKVCIVVDGEANGNKKPYSSYYFFHP